MRRDTNRAVLYLDADRIALVWKSTSTERGRTPGATVEGDVRALVTSATGAREFLVVVGRPLAHHRTIEMPDMPRETVERVLARDWARYVLGSGSYSVSARRIQRGTWSVIFMPVDLMNRSSM